MTSAIDKALRHRQATGSVEEAPEVVGSVPVMGDLANELSDQGQGSKFETTIEGGGKGGWVTLWETKSGIETQVKESNIFWVMEIKDNDGEYLFTPDKNAAVTYVPGVLLCPLHPEHEKRDVAIAAGVGGILCRKANLRSRFDQIRHGEKSHPDEMNTIKEYVDELKDERNQEMEDLQRKLLIQQLRESAPVEEPVATTYSDTISTPELQSMTTVNAWQCPSCRKAPFKTEHGLKIHTARKHS